MFVKSPLTLLKRLSGSVAVMSGPCLRYIVSVALVAAGLIVAAPGQAQDAALGPVQDTASAPCRLCSIDPSDPINARPLAPLRLHVETRLDFDKVVFEGTGSALLALSPDGVTRLTGAATAAGARAMPGSVLIRGEPGRAVRIDLPGKVTLFGEGNGSLSIDSLTTDLPAFPRIGADGTLLFRFGGDLRLTGDSDGIFRGTIDIVVDYL